MHVLGLPGDATERKRIIAETVSMFVSRFSEVICLFSEITLSIVFLHQ